jgi:hypothetical protein
MNTIKQKPIKAIAITRANFWLSTKDSLEKRINDVLSGGDSPVSLSTILQGSDKIEYPSDIVKVYEYMVKNNATAEDKMAVEVCIAPWIRAYYNLEELKEG